MHVLETNRLILRTWHDNDVEALTKINQDPKVMQYFPACQDKQQTLALLKKITLQQQQLGYSLYAVELQSTGDMIGFTGLLNVDENLPFAPAVEIGWRLAAAHWHQGYATEAATAVRDLAFSKLHLSSLVSFTAAINRPSRHVMEKIGMKHDIGADFNHPNLAPDSPLRAHVLYRVSNDEQKK